MPMSTALQRAMNDQIQKEFYAHYLYLAMSAWFEERNFEGFAKWMRIQADEERNHAMRIFDFVLDRGGKVRLEAIPEPGSKWKTALEVFDAARKHEAMVSSSINDLYSRATAEKDYASQVMLQWFITEQVEEEKTSTSLAERLRLVGDSATGLIILDRQLGERTRAE
ncbi:MAG TPA: ferritin [Gemmatimonadales bacterium]|nr:ferritin [Gemmatimonadales bacterium]